MGGRLVWWFRPVLEIFSPRWVGDWLVIGWLIGWLVKLRPVLKILPTRWVGEPNCLAEPDNLPSDRLKKDLKMQTWISWTQFKPESKVKHQLVLIHLSLNSPNVLNRVSGSQSWPDHTWIEQHINIIQVNVISRLQQIMTYEGSSLKKVKLCQFRKKTW